MPSLLVVHSSPSPSLQDLLAAVLDGAADPSLSAVDVVVRPALEAVAADVLAADGVLLGTAAHFGYMSGALKDFFDRVFLHVGGSLDDSGSGAPRSGGLPFGLWVHGRYDTTGAVRSVLSITGALGWRQSAPVLEVLGDVDHPARDAARDLGATLAATLL